MTVFSTNQILQLYKWNIEKWRTGSVTLHINIIKDAGLRSIRVKYKEENSLWCQNCCDVSLAMDLPTSSGFIKEG